MTLQMQLAVYGMAILSHISCAHIYTHLERVAMGWLRLVGSLKLKVSFAKEPYKSNIRNHAMHISCAHIYTRLERVAMGWLRIWDLLYVYIWMYMCIRVSMW